VVIEMNNISRVGVDLSKNSFFIDTIPLWLEDAENNLTIDFQYLLNLLQEDLEVLNDLYQWLTSQKVIESSPLGKAIKYTLGQWPKLIRYVDDGHLSIDNNRAERAIKSLVIGRKNWLFANNPNGADASALLYRIIETAKANWLILYDYVVKCLKELAKPEPDINALLPWNFTH
jgi:hypothetical protein